MFRSKKAKAKKEEVIQAQQVEQAQQQQPAGQQKHRGPNPPPPKPKPGRSSIYRNIYRRLWNGAIVNAPYSSILRTLISLGAHLLEYPLFTGKVQVFKAVYSYTAQQVI